MPFLTPAKCSPVRSAIGFAFRPGLAEIEDSEDAGLGLATSTAGAWASLASGVLRTEAGSGLCLASRTGTRLCGWFGSLVLPGKTSALGFGTGFNRN